MKKILVLGAKGMAGHCIYNYLTSLNKYEVYDEYSTRIGEPEWKSMLENSIFVTEPDIIINCIGILVKDSENNPENAIYLNSYFPHWLENITKDTNIKVIHLSTDCVFKGDKENGGYSEKDEPNGVGFYSRSKALGEIVNKKDLTIRMSIIGSELKETGSGLFGWFLRQTGVVNGYSEAYWNGLTTLELAKAIDKMIDADIVGLYQLAPDYKISKYALLELIKIIWNRQDITLIPNDSLKQDKTLINSIQEIPNYLMPLSYFDMLKEYKEWLQTFQK
jgi:dTDP-4-dehydrorhamnose reductase